ncbi:hypothetical protein [Rhodococcus koreensis]
MRIDGKSRGEFGSADLLRLVRQALDEIDDRPVEVTARRVVRIASLLGETELSVYLGNELSPVGGSPVMNADNIRNLMTDSSKWDSSEGPHETAFERYSANRQLEEGPEAGKLIAHGLRELDDAINDFEREDDLDASNHMHLRVMRGIRERVRHTLFSNLCRMERQLEFTNVNERIFERFRSRVDEVLAEQVPDVLDQFSAVHRRLREAAQRDPEMSSSEEDLAQAAVTCRRILKSVADHLLPGKAKAKSESGHSLGDEAYRNRIFEYIKQRVASGTVAETLQATVETAYTRFTALDQLANKGLHASIGLYEAELCAISTYLVAGELLTLDSATT